MRETEPAIMFYILHGEEEFRRSEKVAELKAQVVSPALGDLNVTVLDGRKLSLAELINACNTLPFMADRRLVIVEDMLQRFDARKRAGRRDATLAPSATDEEVADKLAQALPDLPPTARLVFVERKTLAPSNPILKLATSDKASYVRAFAPLGANELGVWLRKRAEDKGVHIASEAAGLLTSYIGPDLRLLDQELVKLAAYIGFKGTIAVQDVRALVPATLESDIFGLVDSLGLRNRQLAVRHLQTLEASGANDLYLLTMIARQVRLILAAKDLNQRGLGVEQVRQELSLSKSFIAEKLIQQSGRFSMADLRAILERILAIDQGIKTGQLQGMLAIELLIVQVCSQQRPTRTADHQGRSRSRTR
ncbi:MAG: DNA polymerase III subunit delta [Anaerolineae bacterium]